MENRTLFRTGVAGSAVAAVCCFTPLLVILLGAVGLTAWVAWLDYVLIPAFIAFLGLAFYAWRRLHSECVACAPGAHPRSESPEGDSNA